MRRENILEVSNASAPLKQKRKPSDQTDSKPAQHLEIFCTTILNQTKIQALLNSRNCNFRFQDCSCKIWNQFQNLNTLQLMNTEKKITKTEWNILFFLFHKSKKHSLKQKEINSLKFHYSLYYFLKTKSLQNEFQICLRLMRKTSFSDCWLIWLYSM